MLQEQMLSHTLRKWKCWRSLKISSVLLSDLEVKYPTITKDTDTVISIEEIGEIGRVEIAGTNREKINEAIARINDITFVPVVGEVYKGKVVKVMDFGAFVQLKKVLKVFFISLRSNGRDWIQFLTKKVMK